MTDAKVALVQSWLIKARHDLASARVLAASEPPLLDLDEVWRTAAVDVPDLLSLLEPLLPEQE